MGGLRVVANGARTRSRAGGFQLARTSIECDRERHFGYLEQLGGADAQVVDAVAVALVRRARADAEAPVGLRVPAVDRQVEHAAPAGLDDLQPVGAADDGQGQV